MSEIFTNIAETSGAFQPFMEMITDVMSAPDQEFTTEYVNAFTTMVNNVFTPMFKKQSVDEFISGLKEQHLSRKEAVEKITLLKNSMKSYLEELKPSENKKAVLNVAFEIFYDIFDTVCERYLRYDVELPIQLTNGAHMPTYAHETDAAADIYAIEDQIIPAHSLSNVVHTGLRFGTPEGWKLKLSPRSSIGAKTPLRLSNMIGLIDSDYRGELMILFDNNSDSDYVIHKNDRIAQIEIEPVYRFNGVEVKEVSDTERGVGGFGSTGK